MVLSVPESLRTSVYKDYHKSSYDRFMICVAGVEEETMSAQDACSDVFDILGYVGGTSHNGKILRDASSKSRRPDLYRMFLEWCTSGPEVVVGGKKKMPFSKMLGPLPQELNTGVYNAYGHDGYGQFMRRVVALEEGTMSLEQADNDVFAILGYEGGAKNPIANGRLRDDFSKSHRPDLYSMFVEWSTGEQGVVGKKKKKNDVAFSFGVIQIPTAPPETPCLDSLTNEMLVKDLIALDAALAMSPVMLTAMRGAGGTVPLDKMRLQWHQELLKRVSADKKNYGEMEPSLW